MITKSPRKPSTFFFAFQVFTNLNRLFGSDFFIIKFINDHYLPFLAKKNETKPQSQQNQTKQFRAHQGEFFFVVSVRKALKPVPWGQKVSGILDDAGEWLKVKAGSSLDLKPPRRVGEDD